MDACVGKVLDALAAHQYVNNTIVLLWGDHGWHLGDTNSWGKMTNFESGTRNAMLWRVPGQWPFFLFFFFFFLSFFLHSISLVSPSLCFARPL